MKIHHDGLNDARGIAIEILTINHGGGNGSFSKECHFPYALYRMKASEVYGCSSVVLAWSSLKEINLIGIECDSSNRLGCCTRVSALMSITKSMSFCS